MSREKDGRKRNHRLGLVLKKAHGVLYQNLVLQTDELYNFFGDPRPNDLQVYLAHVYLKEIVWYVNLWNVEMKHTFVSN
jgi:hypothetical protein